MRQSWLRVVIASSLVLVVSGIVCAAQAPAAGEKTASQAYLEYRAAFEKAKKVEDLLPYMAAARRKDIESTPAGERGKMFEMIKMFDTNRNVKILKETRSGATATLSVEGTDEGQKATGTITMVREGTAWKVDKEDWKSSLR
ncbi:MAG: DUF4878 domain-containing protein [Acidobacteria bacterium]|nr:DUF4878 domain-containing protein [Acidobacteriota bacterium]